MADPNSPPSSVPGAPAGARVPAARPAPQRTDVSALQTRLLSLPAKQRLDAILACPDVMRVVQQLPTQDLFATVKEVGAADSLELLELLHPRQVQVFLDLDAWRKDRVDPSALGDWLEALHAASPARAVKQILGLDIELLALLFKMHTQVYDLTAEEQPEGEARFLSVTPDQRYAIVFDPDHEKLAQAMQQTVERLFGVDPGFVLRLLESVRWEMPSALEEECYRWRNGRLADLGFVPIEEAGEIFAYIDPDSAAPVAAGPMTSPVIDAEDEEAPQDLSGSVWLPGALNGEGGALLRQAMELLGEDQRRRVAHELVLVANRLHVALGGDAGDPDALRATARRAADTIGIALAYRARGNPQGVHEPLAHIPCGRLFQIGHAVTLRLGRRLRSWRAQPESGLSGEGLLRLDHPLREVVAGLLRTQPLFFAGLDDPRRSDFIHHRSLADVALSAQALSEASFRAALVGGKGLGAGDDLLRALGVEDAATGPSHGVLLASWLARGVLGEPGSFAPLSDEELTRLAGLLRDNAEEGWGPPAEDVIARLCERMGSAAPFPGARSAAEASERAARYARLVLAQAASELCTLPRGMPVDGRFVHALFTTARAMEQREDAARGDDTPAYSAVRLG